MPKTRTITNYLETIAPLGYQESYDNAGLIVGSFDQQITGILCSLDATEEVVQEAINRNCNLLVSHHPIVFGGLKKLNGKNYVERTVLKAIQNNIGLYAIHTNLDNVENGVNAKIAQKIGLENCKILQPKAQILNKLTVFVPKNDTEKLLDALGNAGAGKIGNYSHCTFSVAGEGTFKPNQNASPYIGKANELEKVAENRIEVIFASHLQEKILAAMRKAHPYEEIAFYLSKLENTNPEVGAGMIGFLTEKMTEKAFLTYLKQKMDLPLVKHTALLGKEVQKIAICGGAGGFLLRQAISQQADFFITADYKYHEYFDADQKTVIADIGHYESEIFTVDLLVDMLKQEFSELPILKTTVRTNPVSYFFG